jgi:hypothetical protein
VLGRERLARQWHARGQGFKSPQLHQAQHIGRTPAQGRLSADCQQVTGSDWQNTLSSDQFGVLKQVCSATLVLCQPTLDRLVRQRRENQTECELLDRLDELVDAFADGTLSRADFARARLRVEARTDATGAVLAGQAATRTLAALPVGERALREAWATRGLTWRRAVLAAVVERVVLYPCLPHRNVFDPSRIEVVWWT